MGEMRPKPSDDSSIDRLLSSIENLPSLLGSLEQQVPTDAEPKMRWDRETGTGHIDVGGGSEVPGGYSIKLNPEGENSVVYYGH